MRDENGEWEVSGEWRVIDELSLITYHSSLITYHLSLITYHLSLITYHLSSHHRDKFLGHFLMERGG